MYDLCLAAGCVMRWGLVSILFEVATKQLKYTINTDLQGQAVSPKFPCTLLNYIHLL